MGTNRAQAMRSIEVAKKVERLPATKEAFASGELSEVQVEAVASAACIDPSSEHELLETARTADLASLREKARRVRLSAIDPEELSRRQHTLREFSHHVDDDGMVAGRFRLPPEIGAPIVSRIERETDRVYRTAYQEGRREPRVAYAADALVSLLEGSGKRSATRADLVVVVDLDAYQRGHTHEGERCHIPGVGPVPVSVARRISENAFLKGVVIEGCEITKVRHFGRYIPAELRTALDLGKPPELDGRVCAKCGTRFRVQDDHREALANGGLTSRDNLGHLCDPDHKDKTEQDRQARLLGGGDGRDPP